MRLLLIVWMLSIAGCAAIDLPAPTTTLRDYQQAELPDIRPIALSQPQAVAGLVGDEPAACFTGPAIDDLERFAIAAQANTEALHGAVRAIYAQSAESRALLAAGQSAEELAEIYRELYRSESGRALLIQIGAGVALLLLGAGSL